MTVPSCVRWSVQPARVSIDVDLADAEFDRERNSQGVRQILHAPRIIPAKRGGVNWRIQGVRAEIRQEFPADL